MIANFADHSSNERTFLSWVRTAIAVVGFGLAAGRLGETAPSFASDVVLLGSGLAVVVVAFVRMRHLRRKISEVAQLDDDSFAADVLLVVLLLAMFVMLGAFGVQVQGG